MTAFSEFCIYTIVQQDKLADAFRQGRPATFRESKTWVVGHRLWKGAQKAQLDMPVLLGNATDCSQLLYWGVLTWIEVKDTATTFMVDRVQKLPQPHAPQELVLRSSGQHIAPNFIRPYAICRTPDFIIVDKLKYTTDDYVAAFRRLDLAPHQMRMLLAHYHAPNRTLTATEMSNALGYHPSQNPANVHYGKLGRLVGELLGWQPLPRQIIFVLVTFGKPEREWHWIMRPEVAEALERLGWVEADDYSAIPEEAEMTTALYEGALRRISVNAFERSSAAREKCILNYGCRCMACGVTLGEKYGAIAQGLIHVHHLRQLADINDEYRVDPIQDLRPVCPTCHAVIHSRKPPFTIEEIAGMIYSQKFKK